MNFKFQCSCYPTINSNNFIPERFFKDYHFFEPFNESKTYDYELFMENYGYGYNSYYYKLYVLTDQNKQITKYVVAMESLSEHLRGILLPYCQCSYHRRTWLNPYKYLALCSHLECIDSDFTEQWVINETRYKYISHHNKEKIC